MGKQAIKIVELDVKELIKDLNKAYCDEWLAYYAYWYMAKTASRLYYEDISEFLSKIAKEEEEHAGELTDRILELGGTPIVNPTELEKNANAPYPQPPKETNDYKKIIKVVLEAEAGAIDVYNKIAKKVQGKDHTTYQLITHILSEEIKHEQMFEDLLG